MVTRGRRALWSLGRRALWSLGGDGPSGVVVTTGVVVTRDAVCKQSSSG